MATFGLDELCLRCNAARELKDVIGINVSNNILEELQSISTDSAKENSSDCQWFGNDLNSMDCCNAIISWKSNEEIEKRLESGFELSDEYPHDVANIFSQILRQLPTSLIPKCMNELINDVMQNEDSKLEAVGLFCLMLPTRHLHTLMYVCRFFHKVASHSNNNKMSADSLATVLAPNVIQLPMTQDGTSEFVAAMTTLADFTGFLVKNSEVIGCIPDLLREVTCPPDQCIHRDQWMSMMAEVSMLKKGNRRKSFLDRVFKVCNKTRSTNVSITKDRKRRQCDIAGDEAPAKRRSLQGAAEQVAPFSFNGVQPPLINFVTQQSMNARETSSCVRHGSGSTTCFGAKPRIKQPLKKTPVKPRLGRLGVPYPVTPSNVDLTTPSSCVPEKQRKTFLKKLTRSFLSPSVRRSARKKKERRTAQDDVTWHDETKPGVTLDDAATKVDVPPSNDRLPTADPLQTTNAACEHRGDASSELLDMELISKQASSGKAPLSVDMNNLRPGSSHVFRIDDSITVFDLSDIPSENVATIPDVASAVPDVAPTISEVHSTTPDIALPILEDNNSSLDTNLLISITSPSSSNHDLHRPIVNYSVSSEEEDGNDRKISNKSYEDILDARLESASFVVASPNCSFFKKGDSLSTSDVQVEAAFSSIPPTPRHEDILLESSDQILSECKLILQKMLQDVASSSQTILSSPSNPQQSRSSTSYRKPTPPVRSSSKGVVLKTRSIVREIPRANLQERCIVKMYKSAENLSSGVSATTAVASPVKSISQPSLNERSLERLRQVNAVEKIKLFEDKNTSSRPSTPVKMPPIRAGKVSANIQLFNHMCEATSVRKLSPLPCRESVIRSSSFKLGPPGHPMAKMNPLIPGRTTASVRLVEAFKCRSTDTGSIPAQSGRGMPLTKPPLLPQQSMIDDMIVAAESAGPQTARHRKSKSLDSLLDEAQESQLELSNQARKAARTREQTPFYFKSHGTKVPGTPSHKQLALQTFNIDQDYLDNSPVIRATPKLPRSRFPIAPMPRDRS